MNKIVLGLILYFGNYHISNYFFENDIDNFFILKYGIYSVIIILAIFYKYENHFKEIIETLIVDITVFLIIYFKKKNKKQ